ncbi:hypothetical protein GDO86_005349 [Hymenochirus boettgeri]|uniref:IBB domain-containing protein n=1 Tax=Hymenochirus boettgeri TaxID=247094 RepID=A0A8T2J474_9PIPI|nr:hypothetical protein GDO86_005349 [Hymenochirus boettgeri]
MWRRRHPKHSSVPALEEFRAERRERETALRKARREQQLISKRLLRSFSDDDNVLEDEAKSTLVSEQEIAQLVQDLHHDPKDKMTSLTTLRYRLRREEVRLLFIRVEGGMRALIGLFTCPFANMQMEAARCLHELSHSNEPLVSKACLPATPYLLTYLSGRSLEFMELCLYTLGNLIVESEAVRKQLLLQGVIPAMAQCIKSPHMTVLEAVGYALSQLLQSKEAPEKIIPIVLESGLTQDIVRILVGCAEDWIGVAVEFAWCLHYIVSSHVNNILLITQGIVSKLVQFLIEKAGFIVNQTTSDLELLICPVIRCMGNLLATVDLAGNRVQIQDGRLFVALFVFTQHFLDVHPFIVRECLWTLNNLTVKDPVCASVLLHLNLVPALLHMLTRSKDISQLVITVLCNIADLGPAYCRHLMEKDILPCVFLGLGSDAEMARQSLSLLEILSAYHPFLKEEHGGSSSVG